MKAWAWIVQAVKDIYSFVYTEVGTILKVAKDPAGKFSGKRIIALALVGDLLFAWELPTSVWGWIFAIGKLVAAVVLYWIAEVTKT
jgi:hypothetical protein